jgi:Ca-activated chloride channel homolog
MSLPPPRLACVAAACLAAACGRTPTSPFDPHRPPAGPADPHLVEMSADTTTDLVPAGSPAELAIRIRVSASRVSSGQRPALDLVLLLDTSGSMEGPAIEALRRAAHTMVERMSPRDHLAVVTFDSSARVVIPSTELTASARAAALDKIDGLRARGTTAMADGLALALQQVAQGRAAGTIDRIVLLGDGVANDPAPLPSLVEQARAARISITTLGLGIEFDEGLLGRIALDTGGVYRYVATADTVSDVFDHELTRMQTVVGRNLYLQLQPGPGVTIDDMPGLTPSGAARYAMLGDLAAGELRDVIVPIHVNGHPDGATVELVDAVLTFDDAAGGSGPQRRDSFASTKASADPDKVKGAIKVDLELARARARAASAILQGIALARAGQIDAARKTLEDAEQAAKADAAHSDDELRGLIEQMARVREHLADLVVQPQQTQPARQAGGAGAAYESAPLPSPATAPPETEQLLRHAHAASQRVLDGR